MLNSYNILTSCFANVLLGAHRNVKMSPEKVRSENNRFILARLKMAQDLLEESDKLEGFSGYEKFEEHSQLHRRHEREGLVVYLLLTCFDKLGQNYEYADFQKWITSSKFSAERSEALGLISSETGPVEATQKLLSFYNSRYGVKRAFENGINQLPVDAREKLMSTLQVLEVPEIENRQPNTLYPGLPVFNEKLVEELKIASMFNFRNNFTHGLKQYFRASAPFMQSRDVESSWAAWVGEGKIRYYTYGYEIIERKDKKYQVSMNSWPFILYKSLYSAIGVNFDVTTINLKFIVKLHFPNLIYTLDDVRHADFKKFGDLPDSLIL